MKEYQSLTHTRWDCKYHVVIPKKRRKRIFEVLRKHLGEIFHELAAHKEAKIVEGHIMSLSGLEGILFRRSGLMKGSQGVYPQPRA